MKRKLIRTSTLKMAESDWLSFRDRGVGASDISTIMHLNPYKSSLELYYEKIGKRERPFIKTLRTFFGHYHEDQIADLWQYWQPGGTFEEMMHNYERKIKIRKMRKINAYVQNPEFPHIFVSLDRIISKYDHRGQGALELKTISGWEARKWVDIGVPIGYITQVLTQMAVCEFKFGELAFQQDFLYYDVLPIEWQKNLINTILEMVADFWERVERGRIIMNQIYMAQREFNMRKVQELEAEIHDLEPVADGSERLADFLNDTFVELKNGMIDGTDELLLQAIKHSKIKEKIKDLKMQAIEIENMFKQKIRERSGINFGHQGAIYWAEDKNGKRIFRNRVELESPKLVI